MVVKTEEFLPIGVVVKGDDPIFSLGRVKSLGIPTCQMYAPPVEWHSEPNIEKIKKAMSETGIRITSLVCHFEGESYAGISIARETVGLLNPDTRQERVKKTLSYSGFARRLGIPVLMAHIGFIPEDKDDPNYQGIVEAMETIADYCQSNGQEFALETGQEKADVLSAFIEDVNRMNIKVNFDPANMLSYGSGDPIEALDILARYIVGVHCKDGKGARLEGEGSKECVLGEGEVGFERFIAKLKEIGYTGPLTIEREISGEQQTRDILKARKLLEKLR